MTKVVLLTGGTGFVGRRIAAQLAARCFLIRYVVRPSRSSVVARNEAFESVVETDDLFEESVDRCAKMCEGVDTVVHAAWYAEPGKYLCDEHNFACLTGSLNLGRGAVIAAVRRFVGLGTCFEYDTSPGRLSVETPLKPESPYAAAKAATFLNLASWLAIHQVAFAWCRLFHLYGEGEDERRLVPYIRSRLRAGLPAELTSGEQVRDFLDVESAASMIADVVESNAVGAFNICSGVPVTVRQLAESIAEEYGRRDLLRFGVRTVNSTDPPVVVGEPTTLCGQEIVHPSDRA